MRLLFATRNLIVFAFQSIHILGPAPPGTTCMFKLADDVDTLSAQPSRASNPLSKPLECVSEQRVPSLVTIVDIINTTDSAGRHQVLLAGFKVWSSSADNAIRFT